jgi:hypothetical protein
MQLDTTRAWERYVKLLDGPGPFEQYDCDRNAIAVDDLFQKYDELGFMYPAKRRELDSVWDKVRDNWLRAYRLNGDVLRVYTYHGPAGEFATTTLWRSEQNGWTAEHLAANDPVAAMIMSMGVIAEGIRDNFAYVESWYRPTNPYPNRLYSNALRDIGSSLSSIRVLNYMAVEPVYLRRHLDNRFVIEEVENGSAELAELATEARGHVYALGTRLYEDDLAMSRLNGIYQRAGLTRKRKVVLLYRPMGDRPVGAAIAYRGPCGFNLSLIENRCDILLSNSLSQSETLSATAALVDGVTDQYIGFPPGYIPVMADGVVEDAILTSSSGRLLRRYAHFNLLGDGLPKWYESVVGIIGRVVRHKAAKESRRGGT